MQISNRLLALVSVIIFFTACKKNNPEEEFPVNTNFVSATLVGSLTKDELDAKAAKTGFGTYTSLTKYDVDYYKLIYNTSFKGNMIQVSGLLGIPKNMPKAPSLLSAHHADITRFSDAPSNYPSASTGLEYFASAGFIEMIPDYIGLGVSSAIPQPYYVQSASALTVIDMIKAVKYFLGKKKIAYSPKLFLTGFSEGGYVTIAAQKAIELDSSHQLTVNGSAEGGGALDPGGNIQFSLFNVQSFARPVFVTLLLESYNKTYNINRPYSYYFASPYAEKMPSLLDGTKTIEEIDAQLVSSAPLLVNADNAKPPYVNPTPWPEFQSKTRENSIAGPADNYAPKAPTRFYSDNNSTTNPLFLVIQLDKFSQPGYSNIQFRYIDQNPRSTGQPMLLDAMKWIIGLDQ